MGLSSKKAVPQGWSAPVCTRHGVVHSNQGCFGWVHSHEIDTQLHPNDRSQQLVSSYFCCSEKVGHDSLLASFLDTTERSLVVFITTTQKTSMCGQDAAGWVMGGASFAGLYGAWLSKWAEVQGQEEPRRFQGGPTCGGCLGIGGPAPNCHADCG